MVRKAVEELPTQMRNIILYSIQGGTIGAETLLPNLAYFLQLFFFDDFDFSSVDSNQSFRSELRQGTDSVRSSHIGKICQIFT